MSRLSHKTILSGAAGALGGSAAWAFVLALSGSAQSGLVTEMLLGAIAGAFIGGFIWSREPLAGREFRTAAKRAAFGALAGVIGGAAGAGMGNTLFTVLGRLAADLGGYKASAGVALAAALGWAILGAAVGASGGMMIRSGERVRYGLAGGSVGGLVGGLLFNVLSTTSIWSALAGLLLLGLFIGSFISLVEEALVSAKVKVIKGRHLGREFPILKDLSTIGRDDRNDVCLSGAEGVGLEHAFIRRKNGHYSIETGEKGRGGTGVYVNHNPTINSRLHDGDVIRVGSVILMFSALKKAAAVAALIIGLLLAGSFVPVSAAPANEAAPAEVRITQFDLGEFPLVKAYVSVLDREGRPVRGLSAPEFSLRENGLPAAIREARPASLPGKREPLTIALVIDKSGSMTGGKISRARESVIRFIDLLEPGDRAALFVFSDDVTEAVPFTGDREKLEAATRSIEAGGHTALYDAVAKAVEALNGIAGRRAVIVLTDGIANRGVVSIDRSIEIAAKNNVSVFTIGLGEDVRTARLEKIAEDTGGTYFFTPSEDRLASVYEAISNRIKSEYVVAYETNGRGEYLRNVRVAAGGEAAERSYFQPRSSLFGAGGRPPKWAFLVPLMSIMGFAAVSLRGMERRYKAGHLSLARGRGSKKELDIAGTVTIGRDERNTLGLFGDAAVEQYHAEAAKENGRYLIRDKGSAAGTFVNEKRIAGDTQLADGDIIAIGEARIVFNEESHRACSSCGSPMKAEAKFCTHCGKKSQ